MKLGRTFSESEMTSEPGVRAAGAPCSTRRAPGSRERAGAGALCWDQRGGAAERLGRQQGAAAARTRPLPLGGGRRPGCAAARLHHGAKTPGFGN